MNGVDQGQKVDFSVDKDNLYRQEVITDFKVASIVKFIPIKPDGSEDNSRAAIFLGQTQLMLPQGARGGGRRVAGSAGAHRRRRRRRRLVGRDLGRGVRVPHERRARSDPGDARGAAARELAAR